MAMILQVLCRAFYLPGIETTGSASLSRDANQSTPYIKKKKKNVIRFDEVKTDITAPLYPIREHFSFIIKKMQGIL